MFSMLFLSTALAADLPLESSNYDVLITGTVADIELEQVFANHSTEWMEAVYTFPLDGTAAVDEMSILIGNREIVGEIQQREEARKNYEKAKSEGKAAGLTEQQRPNLFTQSVANIPPGQDITVRLHVVQPIDRVDEGYELVIPLVTGPRFSPAEGVGDVDKITPAVSRTDTGVSVNIGVDLVAGFPVAELYSPTHDTDIEEDGDAFQVFADDVRPNSDFVLRWSLDTQEPQAVALQQDNHMLVRFEAPELPTRQEVVSRELIWVIDTSGSQDGLPLDMAKTAMHAAFDGMSDRDNFALVQFADEISTFSDAPIPADTNNIEAARAWIDLLSANGGTNMIDGVYGGLDMADDPNRERYIIFLTDGLIGNEKDVLSAIEDGVANARVFSFGLGNGTNRWLIEEMARAGGGRSTIVTLGENPEEAIDRFMETIDKPVLTDIVIDWGDWDVEQIHPEQIGDLMAGQPLELAARTAGGNGPIRVEGRLAGRAFSQVIPIQETDGGAVSTMWARAHVASLERQQRWGEIESVKKEIIHTALEYDLLTKYTSFVAIQRKVINRTGNTKRTDQPQELPDGMEFSSSVSREYTPPGDPLLTVDAPYDARSVVAIYPWGDTVQMRWDDLRQRWFHRFLVPRDVPDGQIEIVIFVTDVDGRLSRHVETMFVDSSTDELDVWLEHSRYRTIVHLLCEEPLRTIQVQPRGRPDKRRRINVVLNDALEHQIIIPGLWDDVEILVTDRAMNSMVQEVSR